MPALLNVNCRFIYSCYVLACWLLNVIVTILCFCYIFLILDDDLHVTVLPDKDNGDPENDQVCGIYLLLQ